MVGTRLLMTFVASAAAVRAQALPPWLVPFPGASVTSRTVAGREEAAYVAGATVEEVLAHYRPLFAKAGVGFAPGGDGIGTVLRATASGCDLLLQIRERTGGAGVMARCSAGRSAVRSAVAVASRPPDKLDVSTYDRPVYPKGRITGDAPALHWPEWFYAHGSATAVAPRPRVDGNGNQSLSFEYRTSLGLQELDARFTQLFQTSGMSDPPRDASLGGSKKPTHGAHGSVKGFHYPQGLSAGRIQYLAAFVRIRRNDRTTVTLSVTSMPSRRPVY